MAADSPNAHDSPHAEYQRRLESLRTLAAAWERRHRRLGAVKIALSVAALACLVASVIARATLPALGFLFFLAIFIVLEAAHTRLLRSLRRAERSIAFYKRGLARLENRWMGEGEPGDEFQDESHPYARDLDLFGKGSLFEFLCTARTGIGRQVLARWLLSPAPLDEIQARQVAVTELRPRLDLREELAISGEDLRAGVRPDALLAWMEAPAAIGMRSAPAVAAVLCGIWLASVAMWIARGWWVAVAVASVLSLAVGTRFVAQVRSIVPGERFAPDLSLVATVLARIESEKFSAARLSAVQHATKLVSGRPSELLRRVSRRLESLESRRNPIVAFVDPFVHWTAQTAFSVEKWRARYGRDVRAWLEAVGEMEAITALASYAYEHPADVFPEFASGPAMFEAEMLAHPLLTEAQAVANNITIGGATALFVISGPNMAGKSTFIRAVGINAVLAQCGAPVRAQRLRLSPLQVAASICVLDSLQGGVSRFYAEIRRLKLIAELTKQPTPVLFLLDELLSGTNSQDRRVGAEAMVKSLVAKGAVGLITTHDLALTQMVEGMPQAANFHFADRIENGELRFDYRLTPGVANTSNALKLMRSVGLEV